MDDLNKLLAGSVDEVKAGLPGKSHDDLLKLKAAEQAGEKRTGVFTALDAAIEASDAQRASGTVQMQRAATRSTVAADLDGSDQANIPPAAAIDTSGAPQQIVPDVDLEHPAVDSNPRAGTTETQNRIDFNDPTISGSEAVSQALEANG
jgi:hypothetical protein